uniref:Transmembrane protein 43-like n=1 Tax=Sinocyclocheilus rhinocerous TaxID=307959 RepID=A0A673L1F2_9TELE
SVASQSSTSCSRCEQHTSVHTDRSPGFLERLSASAGGVMAGVCLLALSFYVLFTNEGRALRTASSLDEGLKQVVSLHPDVMLDPQNDGRLVHLSGPLRTAQPLYDPNYGVTVQAVKLQRRVEMYQWVEYSESRSVSVVAMQQSNQLKPFRTRSGDVLEILYTGDLSAEEVFAREHQLNNMKTWALRLGGWALMFLGVSLSTRIIYTLVDWVPVLRELVSAGLKIFALCVSCSLSLLTISVGWIFYRPLLGGMIALLALLPLLLAHARAPSKKNQ